MPQEEKPEYDAPFAQLLGMLPGISADGCGSAVMEIQDKHRQAAGVVQGGLIVTLADYAFFRAVHSTLRPGETIATVELKVNFIAPAQNGELTANAKLVSRGRRIAVGDVEVLDQDHRLIARCLGTYLITAPPK